MQISANHHRRGKRAFSLVEMLVVVAIIGIMAGIAIPVINIIRSNAEESLNRRTAQILASMASGALTAGSEAVAAASSESEVLDLLSVGVFGTGAFEDVLFRVPLSAEEREGLDAYLAFQEGLLIYDASGNSAG